MENVIALVVVFLGIAALVPLLVPTMMTIIDLHEKTHNNQDKDSK